MIWDYGSGIMAAVIPIPPVIIPKSLRSLTLNVQTVHLKGRRHYLQHLDQLSGWATMHVGLPVLALFCSPIIIASLFFCFEELARVRDRCPCGFCCVQNRARSCWRCPLASTLLLCSSHLSQLLSRSACAPIWPHPPSRLVGT